MYAILLDDLHWADADSLEMLDHLTRQPVQAQILWIGTYRSEETQSSRPLDDFLPKLRRNRQVDHVHLNPLTRADVERLVTAQHGACSRELADYLYDRAEGHPLFTVELLNDLVDQDLLTVDQSGHWLPPAHSDSVPVFLKQLITRRINRLGTQVEHLLEIAAVIGELWYLPIVESLAGIPEAELLEAVSVALRAEIVVVENDKAEIYRFAHGLFRQVLYTGQVARRRKRLHEQIAAQLEQQQPTNVFAIAHHYYEAEHWEKAVSYCLAAGEQSVQRFAHYSALQWYRQALRAAERAGDALTPKIQFAVYERLGRTYMALEQREEAEIVYSRLRDVMQSRGDPIAEGYALVSLANVRMRLYQLELAEKAADEALKIGERTGDLRLLTHVHAAQFEAIKDFAQFASFRYLNRYQLLMCEICLYQHKFDQALELAQEARGLAQSKRMLKNVAKSHWLEGRALGRMRRLAEARQHMEEAVAIVDGIRHGSLRWKIRLSLAEVIMQAGKPPEQVLWQARELIDQTIKSLSGSPLQKVLLASDWVKDIAALEQCPAPKSPAYPAGLTQREVEVLQLVAQGASNRQVADALHISVRTVNTHITNILNKLGLENRTAATAFALQHDLLR